jgi:hypothetical protein
MEASPFYLRRAEAAEYVLERWGAPCSAKWLAKLAVVGGGPQFRKIGRFPVYSRADLDAWIEARITAPRYSTSDEAREAAGSGPDVANAARTTKKRKAGRLHQPAAGA